MLDQLLSTVKDVEPLLVERGFEITTKRVKSPGAPDTGYVDFFSSDRAARITMFRDGLCDMEVMRTADLKHALWQHTEFASPDDVRPAVLDFLNRLLTEVGQSTL